MASDLTGKGSRAGAGRGHLGPAGAAGRARHHAEPGAGAGAGAARPPAVLPAAVQLTGLDVDLDRQESRQPRHLRLLGGRPARRTAAGLVAVGEGQEAVGAGGRGRPCGTRGGGAGLVSAAAARARDVRVRHVHARGVGRLHLAAGAEGRAEGAARRLPRRSLRRRPAGSAVHRPDALRDPPAGGGHKPPAGEGRLGPAVLGDPGAGSDPAQVLERARSRPTRATTPPRRASTCRGWRRPTGAATR